MKFSWGTEIKQWAENELRLQLLVYKKMTYRHLRGGRRNYGNAPHRINYYDLSHFLCK